MRVIKVTNYKISDKASDGTVACFLSDLHECDTAPVKELLQRYEPDFVLIGGDYIQNSKQCARGFEFLSYCAGKYPTFCSLGNHEMKYGGDIRADTKATGVTLLDNEDTEFSGLRIGGLSSGFSGAKQGNLKKTPQPDLEFLNAFSKKDGFKILLSHHPEYYPGYIKNTDIDLTLSGHAHGGQWRFFDRGLFAPGQGIFPKYTSGMYDGRLIVSRGLGDSHRVPRINNSFEFVVLNIK